ILTLNQCLGDRFFPKVEKYSTGTLAGHGKEATLAVKYRYENILQIEQDSILDGKMTFFIKYREAKAEAEKHQSHNFLFTHALHDGTKRIVITDFKGGFTKFSTILGRLISVQYEPLTEDYTIVKLDCGALVPGTASLKKKK